MDEPTTYMDDNLVKLSMKVLLEHVISHDCSIIVLIHDYNELYGCLTEQEKSVNMDRFHLGGSENGNITDVMIIEPPNYCQANAEQMAS